MNAPSSSNDCEQQFPPPELVTFNRVAGDECARAALELGDELDIEIRMVARCGVRVRRHFSRKEASDERE